jgi:hypothetical protein
MKAVLAVLLTTLCLAAGLSYAGAPTEANAEDEIMSAMSGTRMDRARRSRRRSSTW